MEELIKMAGDITPQAVREWKKEEKEKAVKIIFNQPEKDEKCEGCKHYTCTTESFSHEFGTHAYKEDDCNFDFDKNPYGECQKITNVLDDEIVMGSTTIVEVNQWI